MPNAGEKIAKILRADRHVVETMDARLAAITGKRNVLGKIVAENEARMKNCLLSLGAAAGSSAKEVYDALISKVESDDYRILEALGNPVCYRPDDCNRILALAKQAAEPGRGFFLKKETMADLLRHAPPAKVLAFLKYPSVDAMLAKENLFEVFASLRFVEGSEWLNGVFFKQYEKLTPDDFEEREIEVRALSERWDRVAKAFVKKKHHNISHLKEAGLIFVIPVALGISGELLRMLSLVFHYLHEILFYSDLFRREAEAPRTFAQNLISLLRGDVPDRRFTDGERSHWLVIQRYLAKDDENDWRLFAPHVNPEALHWANAAGDLMKTGKALNGFSPELAFWRDLDWVGDYFKDETGNSVLVSFNLVDTVMSLVKEKELVKYLYHHQEALWNKIFEAYFSREELEASCKKHLLAGYFEI
ncbi:MAG: hypothetical protein V1656_00310 [Candidatus Jorgensenbacteria bacterium]